MLHRLASCAYCSFFLLTVLLIIGCQPIHTPMFSFEKAQPFDGELAYEFPEEFAGIFIVDYYEIENQLLSIPSYLDLVFGNFAEETDLLIVSELNDEKTELTCYYSIALKTDRIDTSRVISRQKMGRRLFYHLPEGPYGLFDTICFQRLNKQYYRMCDFVDTVAQSNYIRYDQFSFKDHGFKNSSYFEFKSDERIYEKQKFVAKRNDEGNIYYFNMFDDEKSSWNIEVFKLQESGNIKRYSSRLARDTEKEQEVDTYLEQEGMNYRKETTFEQIDTSQTDSVRALIPDSSRLKELEYVLNPSQQQFEEMLGNPLFFNTFEFKRIEKPSFPYYLLILAAILLSAGGGLFVARKRSITNLPAEQKALVYERLEKGQLEEALELLKNALLASPSKRKVRLIQSNLKRAKVKYQQSQLTFEEFNKQEAIATAALLNLLKEKKKIAE